MYPKLLSDPTSNRPDVLVRDLDAEVAARKDGFTKEVPAPGSSLPAAAPVADPAAKVTENPNLLDRDDKPLTDGERQFFELVVAASIAGHANVPEDKPSVAVVSKAFMWGDLALQVYRYRLVKKPVQPEPAAVPVIEPIDQKFAEALNNRRFPLVAINGPDQIGVSVLVRSPSGNREVPKGTKFTVAADHLNTVRTLTSDLVLDAGGSGRMTFDPPITNPAGNDGAGVNFIS